MMFRFPLIKLQLIDIKLDNQLYPASMSLKEKGKELIFPCHSALKVYSVSWDTPLRSLMPK
jgi:hypothetical protein